MQKNESKASADKGWDAKYLNAKTKSNSVWPKTTYHCRKARKQVDLRISRRNPLTAPLGTIDTLRNCNKTVNYIPTMQDVAAGEACQKQEEPIQQQSMVPLEPNLVGPEALLRKSQRHRVVPSYLRDYYTCPKNEHLAVCIREHEVLWWLKLFVQISSTWISFRCPTVCITIATYDILLGNKFQYLHLPNIDHS